MRWTVAREEGDKGAGGEGGDGYGGRGFAPWLSLSGVEDVLAYCFDVDVLTESWSVVHTRVGDDVHRLQII